ncbi:hypothetical protein PV08_05422 [Exophiala spinifera]|uniref:Major facilitator superfamily (MFS) profile domain-containing protein n=1 Tax=Exophiala spinifera TaxID=91928 RepID=A0A0D1YK67_9EURO|nr:uncharacterized protein PV08_05422 [Exophiala spinifera]KIW15376.1 hypothetical protein PV08_05422 [Exophiala spinifera]
MNYTDPEAAARPRQSVEEYALADLPLLADELARNHDELDELDAFDGETGDDVPAARRFQRPSKNRSPSEPSLTVREAIRAYPAAIFWSFAVSMCIIMEGYDAILIVNFFAFPQFQRKYGEFVGVTEQTQTGYQVAPAWMAAVGNASGFGAFLGTFLNGYLVSIFGQKRVLLGALVLLSCFIFLTFFAPNIQTLLVGQLLCGFPWAIFATTAPAYSSEILPMSLRVFGTSWVNMCFIIGQLISAGVLRACLERDDEWAFRIPFSVQWIWPAFLIPLLCFAPESPWHLVRQNRLAEAEASLRRLQRASYSRVDVTQTLADIIHTNRLEEKLSVGTSYWDCFRGFELRRTEIACVCFAGQVLSGLSFAYNASYFFEQVGLSASTSYSLNIVGTALALLGTLVNWFYFTPRMGRRTLYLLGMSVMAGELFLIGALNAWTHRGFVAVTQAGLTLVWTFTYQVSVGQLGWSFPAEVGSTRLRQKTVCLARNAYYVVAVASGVLQPYFLNPEALNLRGYAGFIWGSTAVLTWLWAYYRLPETRDRTYEQLDVLFAKRVSARDFARTRVVVDDDDDDDDGGGGGGGVTMAGQFRGAAESPSGGRTPPSVEGAFSSQRNSSGTDVERHSAGTRRRSSRDGEVVVGPEEEEEEVQLLGRGEQ